MTRAPARDSLHVPFLSIGFGAILQRLNLRSSEEPMTATVTAACVQNQGLADMDARIEAATALARALRQV